MSGSKPSREGSVPLPQCVRLGKGTPSRKRCANFLIMALLQVLTQYALKGELFTMM